MKVKERAARLKEKIFSKRGKLPKSSASQRSPASDGIPDDREASKAETTRRTPARRKKELGVTIAPGSQSTQDVYLTVDKTR